MRRRLVVADGAISVVGCSEDWSLGVRRRLVVADGAIAVAKCGDGYEYW